MIYYIVSLFVFVVVFYLIGGKYKWFLVFLALVGLLYHWFQIRPEKIRKECAAKGLHQMIISEDKATSTKTQGLTQSQFDGVDVYRNCLKNNDLYD